MTSGLGLRARMAGELRTPEEVREAVYLFSGDAAAKQSRFWLLLVLSTAIATAGVVADSTATVVGAMIIAPLATPIQGVAAAIAAAEAGPLGRSAGILVVAVGLVVGLSAVLALLLPDVVAPDDNSQITGRIAPTLVDLAAAAATGLAGAFAIARRDIGDILPGVAIAISLVPPLAVVGVTAVEAEWSGALGAMLLFSTNVLAMIVLGAALFGALGVLRPAVALGGSEFRRTRVLAIIGGSAAAVVAALALTTFRTVQLSTWRDDAAEAAGAWARGNGEQLLLTRFEGDDLVFVVAGRGGPDDDRALPALLRDVVPSGTSVTVNRIVGDRTQAGLVP